MDKSSRSGQSDGSDQLEGLSQTKQVINEGIAGRIMVALDFATADKASALVRNLHGIPCYMKVGMQLF